MLNMYIPLRNWVYKNFALFQLCAVRRPIKLKSEEEIEEGLCVLCGKQIQTIFVGLRVKKGREI